MLRTGGAAVRQAGILRRMTYRITLWDRVRSFRHEVSLAISEHTGRIRRVAEEVPAGSLPNLSPEAVQRIDQLRARYSVCFEGSQDVAGALQAYEYLDFLDQALQAWRTEPRDGLVVHDVGCASFSYASALSCVFHPARLTGIELEGYRRLRGGVNRAEKAAANVRRLPSASFVVADYSRFVDQADLITAFFPFVSPKPVLGWRMPLKVLHPEAMFARIRGNLAPQGTLWMINHSDHEATVAANFAIAAGLEIVCRHACRVLVRPRPAEPVVSMWKPRDPHDS